MTEAPALPIPSSLDEIDSAWLTAVLRRAGRLPAGEVRSIRVEVVGEELGFTGVVARVWLTYEGTRPDALPSLVVKLPVAARATATTHGVTHAANPAALRRAIARAKTEVRFYAELASARPCPAPASFHSALDEAAGRAVLVLEDVHDAVQGDVLAGLSPAQAEAALVAIAPFHAAWWMDESPATAWLASWPGDGAERARRYREQARQVLAENRWSLDARAARSVRQLAESYAPALQELAAQPATLVHADFHADNLLFRAGTGGCVVLDWQTVARGSPATDLNVLLVGCLTVADRRAHEAGLLDAYHAALARAGVAALSRPALDRTYRLATAWHLAGMVGWLALADPDVVGGRERALLEQVLSEGRVFDAAAAHGW